MPMVHCGDIMEIAGHRMPPVDVIIGGSPCQDLSVAGKRAGLAGSRSGLFMELIRVIKEMRALYGRPRYMVWENVPGAFSSNKGEDFRAVLEETIRIASPYATDIPLPPNGRWPLADAWYGDGWSVAYRVLDAQFWGVPQRRRRIALVADFGGQTAPEILFVRNSVCGDAEQSRKKGEAIRPGIGNCDGESGRRFVYENHGQDCRFNGPLTVSQTVSSTFRMGGNNQPLVLEADGTVRRMTPLECERLQGYPDGWTDIGKWVDRKGRLRDCTDSARYKALGNSIAIPPWTWVLNRLCAQIGRPATMASLFDGIGGFPLIWERLNGKGSCLWASEIEDFPIAVTQYRFSGSGRTFG